MSNVHLPFVSEYQRMTDFVHTLAYAGVIRNSVTWVVYRVRSFALQLLSAGNSTEFSQADNSKTIQPREINLTSLDSLGSCESIYVYFKPQKIGRKMN